MENVRVGDTLCEGNAPQIVGREQAGACFATATQTVGGTDPAAASRRHWATARDQVKAPDIACVD